MKSFFPSLCAVEVRDAIRRKAVAVIPIGTVEANGAALPLGSDYMIPEALAKAVAEKTGDLWLPPVTYGVSGTLTSYSGTISVSAQFLQKYVEMIALSLIGQGFEHILFLTYHMPNQFPVSWACREIRRKTGVVVPSINPASLSAALRSDLYPQGASAFGHGGEPAASLLLHLHPEAVCPDQFEAATKQSFDGMPIVVPETVSFGQSRVNMFLDIEHVSPTSGWGDPTAASKETGKELFTRMVDKVAGFVGAFREMDTRKPLPTVAV